MTPPKVRSTLEAPARGPGVHEGLDRGPGLELDVVSAEVLEPDGHEDEHEEHEEHGHVARHEAARVGVPRFFGEGPQHREDVGHLVQVRQALDGDGEGREEDRDPEDDAVADPGPILDASRVSADVRKNQIVARPGQHKGAKFSTFKAHISVSFHSFRLIFGRVIISLQDLERWILFLTQSITKHSS